MLIIILLILLLIFIFARFIKHFHNTIYLKTVDNNFRFSDGANKFEK